MKFLTSVFYTGGLLVALVFLSGCKTPQKYATHKEMYAQGRYIASVNAFQEDMDKRIKKAGKEDDGTPKPVAGSRKYALDDIEIGAGYRAAQEFSPSNEAYERAEQAIREQQEAGLLGSSLRNVGAIFTNDNSLPYQIQEYDSIMVNTYKALNLLQEGNIDGARVEFKRVEERQRMAAETFRKQIAKAEAEEEKSSQSNPDVAGSSEEEKGGLKGKIKKMMAEKFEEAKEVVTGSIHSGDNRDRMEEYEQIFNADTWGAQEAFTNPFSTFMQGLFLLVYGEDQSDAESAVHALAKAFRTEPDPSNVSFAK